jgi:hypothetical protein
VVNFCVMDDTPFNQANRIGAGFLITDVDLGFTFMDVAETSKDDEVIRRNRQNARKVYDTALRLLSKLSLNNEERQTVEVKLAVLKKRLEAVGEEI